jgi:hypothetical protein
VAGLHPSLTAFTADARSAACVINVCACMGAADGFSVGAYNFSCVKDCPAATCIIKREYEKGKPNMIVGALPDAIDTLACGSKITHL